MNKEPIKHGLGTFIYKCPLLGKTIGEIEKEFNIEVDSYGDWVYNPNNPDKSTILEEKHIHFWGDFQAIKKMVDVLNDMEEKYE